LHLSRGQRSVQEATDVRANLQQQQQQQQQQPLCQKTSSIPQH
jgi:hypothetical protein